MGEHPIENLMNTAMNSIKDMIDVNTIVGEPIQASNNTVIVPISKVGFGFAAGGSEFKGETLNEYNKKEKEEQVQYRLPFGGGSGAGVNISPIAFLVVKESGVKLLPIEHNSCFDRLIDYIPDMIEKINCILNKHIDEKMEENKLKLEQEKNENEKIQDKRVIEEVKEEELKDNTRKNVEEKDYHYRPKRNVRYHKPIENYEFEYDETDEEND